MNKNKHLSLSERISIEKLLEQHLSFKAIGRELGRDCTTISKEVKSYVIFRKSGCYGQEFNDCSNRKNCTYSKLCHNPSCKFKLCFNCSQ